MAGPSSALLLALADGRYHSGEDLAATLGITRAAVWKRVHALERFGLRVHAARGRGYRLDFQIEWLEADVIDERIQGRCAVESLTVDFQTDSTNQRLLEMPPPRPGRVRAYLAEFQTAGRGRRGRPWHAPLGGSLCLSIAASFESAPTDFAALGLAVGVVVRRVLAEHGCTDVELKWPNDLMHCGRKVGGILIEAQSEAHGPTVAVIGLGLNVRLSPEPRDAVGDWVTSATDLNGACAAVPPRNVLAGDLIAALGALLGEYPRTGFSRYREEWRRADHLAGRQVEIAAGPHAGPATALGIDDDGALIVGLPDGTRTRLCSGEVSVRRSWI